MLKLQVSVIIPVYNEAKSLLPLVSEIEEKLKPTVQSLEVVIINDGSTDNTQEIARQLENSHKITYLENDENLGQGKTLLRGMKKARYSTLVTMDGDFQVDPSDIEAMLWVKNNRGFDFVCSKRRKRADDSFRRHIPSALGNFLISVLFNTDFSDIGSSLKVIDKVSIEKLSAFKNIHRYLNIILHHKGLTYVEMAVTHRKRLHGNSRYNFTKFIKVLFELIYLKFYLKKLR